MSVKRYPDNDVARRSRTYRAIRPHGKPPGYQKDFTPRDKRGRPLKDREGIKKPKQIPKGLPKAAQALGRSLLKGRAQRLLQLAPEAVEALNRLDEWSDDFWLDKWNDMWIVEPGAEGVNTEFFELHRFCREWDGFCSADNNYFDSMSCDATNYFVSKSSLESEAFGMQYGPPDSASLGFKLYNFVADHGTAVQLRFAEGWIRKEGTSEPTPDQYFSTTPGRATPAPSGSELTWEFPLEWPWPNTWADAVAIPGSQPDGSPDPKKSQPSRKDAQAETTTVPFVPGLAVVLIPVTEVVPVPQTQVIVTNPGNTDTTVGTLPPSRTISRPPREPKVKERKLTLMAAAPMTWAVINFATEAVDFLGVLHDALPEDLRAKKKSGWSKPKVHEMAEAIYANYDKIDLATAVENYVNEWIEDQWYGRSGIAGKKANQATGAATGADRALTQGGAGPGEAPEVHLDVETGEWELTTPWGDYSGRMDNRRIDYEPNS